jgi:hypothetical protein
MGAMLTMLTTGIKSGPASGGMENGSEAMKTGSTGKSGGGISSKKVNM